MAAARVSGAESALTVYPLKVSLPAGEGSHRLLVSSKDAEGLEADITAKATFVSHRLRVATVSKDGIIRSIEPGTATITVKYRQQTQTVTVMVEPAHERRVSFLHDIIPIINRAGCNAGACHAKPKGQKGFALSVFSYDPEKDYEEIVKESHGRRVFPTAPDESLVLQKPTMAIEHEGGLRFERDSNFYNKIKTWIGTGMVYANPDDPHAEQITVYPKQRLYTRGANQPLMVQARFSDGSVRDVTHLSVFESRDKELVKVDAHGRMNVQDRFGEAAVTVRFLDKINVATVTVPTDFSLPDSLYDDLPVLNEIDTHVYAQLKWLGFFPSELCTDAEFLRRAYLDAAGAMPSPEEALAFTTDEDPQKRNKVIDRLLEHPLWADHWATKWSDLIRPNDILVGAKGVFALDQWTREQFRQNLPYDQFVRRIITAEGHSVRNGATVVFRDRPKPEDVATLVAQVFLGVRIACARCHHHPLEKWSQKDFYQLAAFFSQVKQHGGRGPDGWIVYHSGEGEIKHPVTDRAMHPTPPEGDAAVYGPDDDPRTALADWMTDPDNAFLAIAVTNRVWGEFMGRGIVHPVDDFRISNPPTNPPLLAALTKDFVDNGFDLKHLMRTIMRSRVYQLSSVPNNYNATDDKNFSRYYRKLLPAEVLLDAVADLTETHTGLLGLPVGGRAIETPNGKIPSHLMSAFGRPVPLADPPCFRSKENTLIQSLHLMNSEQLQARIADKDGRATRLAADETLSIPQAVQQLYLAGYGRHPTDVELADIRDALLADPGATRQSVAEDIMWAMINSTEFIFNH